MLSLLLHGLLLMAQTNSLSKLEQQKKQVESDIAYTNSLIDKTKSEQKASLDNLNLIQTNIGSRKELIANIDKQLIILSAEIANKQKKVAMLHDDLAKLKENYAKMITFAYRNRNTYAQLMFILAADNLNQAYRRLSYLKAYSDYRVKQARNISEQSEAITRELAILKVKKAEQEYLLGQKTIELVALDIENKQYQITLESLQTREKELRNDLEEKKKLAAKLNKQIEDAIAEEVRREEVRRRDVEKRSKAEAVKMAEAEVQANSKFEKLRGRLPMPVAKGVIVTRFGIYDHQVLKGIKVISNGIDISTDDGAVVSVVADGVVRRIFITGAVTSVLVQHGLYYTVYTHLKAVTVQAGEVVRARQPLGLVTLAPDSDRAILHFELWKQTVKPIPQDPEQWLAK
jgi:septal ring factor EnvC (AmiA/AmiB activator)